MSNVAFAITLGAVASIICGVILGMLMRGNPPRMIEDRETVRESEEA